MDIANLFDNEKMLNNDSLSKEYWYFIVESSLDQPILIEIKDSYYLIPIEKANIKLERNELNKGFLDFVNELKNINGFFDKYYYILIIKTCSLTHPEEAKGKDYEN